MYSKMTIEGALVAVYQRQLDSFALHGGTPSRYTAQYFKVVSGGASAEVHVVGQLVEPASQLATDRDTKTDTGVFVWGMVEDADAARTWVDKTHARKMTEYSGASEPDRDDRTQPDACILTRWWPRRAFPTPMEWINRQLAVLAGTHVLGFANLIGAEAAQQTSMLRLPAGGEASLAKFIDDGMGHLYICGAHVRRKDVEAYQQFRRETSPVQWITSLAERNTAQALLDAGYAWQIVYVDSNPECNDGMETFLQSEGVDHSTKEQITRPTSGGGGDRPIMLSTFLGAGTCRLRYEAGYVTLAFFKIGDIEAPLRWVRARR
jgi:hypothetical protein